MKRMSYNRGFTLIEVILAVGIMAIALGVIVGVFFSAIHLRDRTHAAVDTLLPVHQATTALRHDLQCVMKPGGALAGAFKVGSVIVPNRSQPVAIDMHTATGALQVDHPWADIQDVTYELVQPAVRSPNGGSDLIRSVTRNLLCATAMPDVDDQFVLGGVQNIHFSCYDGTQWQDAWDTTDTNAGTTNLPFAVRVQIQLVGASPKEPIEVIVPLVSQSLTNQLQTNAY